MIALWDTTGTDVVRALSAERRSAGGVTTGLALTLITIVDEKRVKEAEAAAATAAAAHPCRLLIVVRGTGSPATETDDRSRLDAEIVVGGRLGPAEAVVLRMQGRLTRHAESVIIPLLASDVPVVTWWHDEPPAAIAADALGVVAERRITDVAQAADPIAALRQRADDYAPGDTDLAWTRTTPWRTLLAGALDPATEPVVGVAMIGDAADPTTALLRGWLAARLGVNPILSPGRTSVDAVTMRLADGAEISVTGSNSTAIVHHSGLPDRLLPLPHRPLGEQLAEELRRLDPDQTYAAALAAATGVANPAILAARPRARVHVWPDPLLDDTAEPES